MGCSASVGMENKPGTCGSNNVSFKPETISNMTITSTDKRLIKKTWRIVSNDMPRIGAKIFLKIFILHPSIKQIFPCRAVTGDKLLQDPNFKGHATRFMQAVGAAVDNIDDLDSAMAPLLFGLGQEHIHYPGFKVQYFDAFTEAIMTVWQNELGIKFTPEVAQVWEKMFDFMMTNLKNGFLDAKSKKTFLQHPA